MNKWFYAKDRQAIGPLSTPEMHELIGQGACTRTTLVWTRGMRDWLPACMAAWMWEERSDRRDVTAAGDGASDVAHGDGNMASMVAADDAPAVKSEPRAERRSVVGPATTMADDVQGQQADAPDAGVVGRVRKLFGLG